MTTPQPSAKKQSAAGRKARIALFVVAATTATYVISLFVPWVYPYTRYPIYLAKCGGAPIAATDFAAAYSYDRPGDKYYGIDPFVSQFFCTEAEAQAAGYHHNALNNTPS